MGLQQQSRAPGRDLAPLILMYTRTQATGDVKMRILIQWAWSWAQDAAFPDSQVTQMLIDEPQFE